MFCFGARISFCLPDRTGIHCVTQTGHKFPTIFLPPFSKGWDYRCELVNHLKVSLMKSLITWKNGVKSSARCRHRWALVHLLTTLIYTCHFISLTFSVHISVSLLIFLVPRKCFLPLGSADSILCVSNLLPHTSSGPASNQCLKLKVHIVRQSQQPTWYK